MGQTLSEPKTDKTTTTGSDHRLAYAASEMQGWRISMEDAHVTILNLTEKLGVSFFGVYDGHGGKNVALYCGGQLHHRIANDPAFSENDIPRAIKNGFLGTDADCKQHPELSTDPSGCTANIVIITDDTIYSGNAGDSRVILSVNGAPKPLSEDHKPVNEGESQRILAAGGFVEFGRVNGNLALSRAIGDFEFKKNPDLPAEDQVVTANPDITIHKINKSEDEFLVMACDGIWDCMTNKEVVEYVRRELVKREELGKVCESLMNNCLAKQGNLTGGIGCDNMTVIIIALLYGKSMEEWYARFGPPPPIQSSANISAIPTETQSENVSRQP